MSIHNISIIETSSITPTPQDETSPLLPDEDRIEIIATQAIIEQEVREQTFERVHQNGTNSISAKKETTAESQEDCERIDRIGKPNLLTVKNKAKMCTAMRAISATKTDEINKVRNANLIGLKEVKCTFRKHTFTFRRPTCGSRNPVLILGDFFSMSYLALRGIRDISSKVASSPIASAMFKYFGICAGIIYFSVGIVGIIKGLDHLKLGQTKKGWRLIIGGALALLVGSVMFFTSIGKAGALAGLMANPYTLPLLFMIRSAPLIWEILKVIYKIEIKKNDLGSRLNLTGLKQSLANLQISLQTDKVTDDECDTIKTYLNLLDNDITTLSCNKGEEILDSNDPHSDNFIKSLTKKMESFQSEIGTEGGIEAFNLFAILLENADKFKATETREESLKNIITQIEKVEKAVTAWNSAQRLRAFQQFLYFVGFAISMSFIGVAPTHLTKAFDEFAMAGANLIPFYTDVHGGKWPFMRNTPAAPDKETVSDIQNKIEKIAPALSLSNSQSN